MAKIVNMQRYELEQCLRYEGVSPEKIERIADEMLTRYPDRVADFISASQNHKRKYGKRQRTT